MGPCSIFQPPNLMMRITRQILGHQDFPQKPQKTLRGRVCHPKTHPWGPHGPPGRGGPKAHGPQSPWAPKPSAPGAHGAPGGAHGAPGPGGKENLQFGGPWAPWVPHGAPWAPYGAPWDPKFGIFFPWSGGAGHSIIRPHVNSGRISDSSIGNSIYRMASGPRSASHRRHEFRRPNLTLTPTPRGPWGPRG